MTRTARALSTRALLKDRSVSRTGLDASLRKHGAGTHNWGALAHERALEDAALYDVNDYDEEEGGYVHREQDAAPGDNEAISTASEASEYCACYVCLSSERSTLTGLFAASDEPTSPVVSGVTAADVANARKIRKGGAKLDLGEIARSSAAVTKA
ncbi:hypothetical protein BD626DRAFT_494535 [Schizophyllum amplum]|uniref:Hyaluronan/mRNA-binding protein domain-containing protein n=1 Tax=Schizophyllum amplum TaxID=97359 RepID=A0A550CFQ0_9AGAR|nr:hypothetical protein BD626DRAFT_494535 [Auriculariopsis ampla]